jgi:hypothetical protein
MSDMAYAVHTRTCIYLLDDEGICRWTLAPTGVPAPGADRCVGAQFVACLDIRVEGGLVGELMIGAAALFARVERGRFVLLRTPIIEYVEFRSDDEAEADEPAEAQPEPEAEPPNTERLAAMHYEYQISNPPTAPFPDGSSTGPLPVRSTYERNERSETRPGFPAPPAYVTQALRNPSYDEIEIESDDLEEVVDVEELVTFSEVTLTIPLYRPDAQEDTPIPPRRGIIGPGRRLR